MKIKSFQYYCGDGNDCLEEDVNNWLLRMKSNFKEDFKVIDMYTSTINTNTNNILLIVLYENLTLF